MAPSATTLASETEGNAKLGALGKTVSGKKLKIRSYPKFESLEEERLYRKQHLAAAFRMFALHSHPFTQKFISSPISRFADRGFDEGVAGHM